LGQKLEFKSSMTLVLKFQLLPKKRSFKFKLPQNTLRQYSAQRSATCEGRKIEKYSEVGLEGLNLSFIQGLNL